MAQAREPQAEALRRLLRARRLRGPFPPHGSRPPRRIRPGGAPRPRRLVRIHHQDGQGGQAPPRDRRLRRHREGQGVP